MGGFVGYPRNVADGVLTPQKLNKAKNKKHVIDAFDARPTFTPAAGHGSPAGTTGAINVMRTGAGAYEYFILGAGQSIVAPVWDPTNGLGVDIALDAVISEGLEIAFGPNIVTANQNRGRLNFKIGTDKGFFARLKIYITDATGFGPFHFGFRKVQAFASTFTTYTDYAAFELQADLDILIATDLNDAGEVATDTTQNTADLTSREFEIRVTQGGAVSFRIDGLVPTVNRTNFSFDAGDVVIPFCRLLHATDVAEATFLQEFEAGYLPERG